MKNICWFGLPACMLSDVKYMFISECVLGKAAKLVKVFAFEITLSVASLMMDRELYRKIRLLHQMEYH